MILEAVLAFGAAYVGYLLFKYPSHALGTRRRPDLIGPKGWPPIGNLPLISKINARSLEYFTQFSRPGTGTFSLPPSAFVSSTFLRPPKLSTYKRVTLTITESTTAQTLSWTFYRLIKGDPSILAALREEVDRLGEVTFDTYKNFVQVHAALTEGIRLHPPVPDSIREAIGEDVLPGGTKIYPGEHVHWCDWKMARDPAVWGDDCCECKPSRWIDESGNLVRVSSFKFHAFNGGPRLCLGQNLAYFEAISVIVEIVRSFDLQFAPDYLATVEKVALPEATPFYGPSLTLPMKEPFRVIVKRRG